MTFEIQPERFALITHHHDHGNGAVILLRGLLLPPHTLNQVNFIPQLQRNSAVYNVGQTFIRTEKSLVLFFTRPILCVISKYKFFTILNKFFSQVSSPRGRAPRLKMFCQSGLSQSLGTRKQRQEQTLTHRKMFTRSNPMLPILRQVSVNSNTIDIRSMPNLKP